MQRVNVAATAVDNVDDSGGGSDRHCLLSDGYCAGWAFTVLKNYQEMIPLLSDSLLF